MRKLASPALLLATFLFLLPSGRAQGIDPTPVDMVLRKRVTPPAAAPPSTAVTRPSGVRHVVKSGETLGGILLARGVRPAEMTRMIALTQTLNPGLENPDRIFPGQQILLPGAETPLPEGPPVPAAPAPAAAPPASRRPAPAVQFPEPPPLGREAALSLAAELFEGLDEEFAKSGTLRLPVSRTGSLSIDAAAFPRADLSTGRGLILDVNGRFPEEWGGIVEKQWGRYHVLDLSGAADARSLVESIFAQSGFHSVTTGRPLLLGRGARVELRPDYIVEKKPGSLLEGSLYLVDLESDPERFLPPEIRELARAHQIAVVELYTGDGAAERSLSARAGSQWPRKVTASDSRALAYALAEEIGLDISWGQVVTLHPRGETALEVKIVADLMLARGEDEYAVFFGDVEPWTRDLLQERGARVVDISRNWEPASVIQSLIEGLGIAFEGTPVAIEGPGGAGSRYRVTVPGFLLDLDTRRLLVTPESLQASVVSLLARDDIEILRYQIP